MERAGFARRTLPRWKTVTKDWEQPEGAEGHRQNEWMTVGSSPLSRHDWRWTRRKKEERTRPDEVRKRWGMRWTKWWKTRSRPAHGLYVFHFPLSIVSRLLPSWSPASCSLRRYALRSLHWLRNPRDEGVRETREMKGRRFIFLMTFFLWLEIKVGKDNMNLLHSIIITTHFPWSKDETGKWGR